MSLTRDCGRYGTTILEIRPKRRREPGRSPTRLRRELDPDRSGAPRRARSGVRPGRSGKTRRPPNAHRRPALENRGGRRKPHRSARPAAGLRARGWLRIWRARSPAAGRALRALGGRRATAQRDLDALLRRGQALETEIASRRESLGRLLTLRYLNGEQSALTLLFSGEEPGRIARA